ncbi:hypothetical protein K505DRAFT_125417 [Melanomma pulvis-pyrius CBS 109.77]|uniref:Uncharacterized protein n=1 Tax=Melanomma pulvis-pyrius CBS 109.77 TaxID=1314802 RepID=A0A6A6WUB2_9PLEO|nr:hypothetical protein K505DRAFT_125417 [Melanomma pulvis-pyrius CBS 109.77]
MSEPLIYYTACDLFYEAFSLLTDFEVIRKWWSVCAMQCISSSITEQQEWRHRSLNIGLVGFSGGLDKRSAAEADCVEAEAMMQSHMVPIDPLRPQISDSLCPYSCDMITRNRIRQEGCHETIDTLQLLNSVAHATSRL